MEINNNINADLCINCAKCLVVISGKANCAPQLIDIYNAHIDRMHPEVMPIISMEQPQIRRAKNG
jgi:hypothetical protein